MFVQNHPVKLLTAIFLLLSFSLHAQEMYQKKFTPVSSPGHRGYNIKRTYGTLTQVPGYSLFMTASNDSAVSCLSIMNWSGELYHGYDLHCDTASLYRNKENIFINNTCVSHNNNDNNDSIYGMGTFQRKGTAADQSYPAFFKFSPLRADSTGSDIIQVKLFELKDASLHDFGGGNDILVQPGGRLTSLMNFIPGSTNRYGMTRNPNTFYYKQNESICLMDMSRMGGKRWAKLYSNPSSQPGALVGLSFIYTSADKYVITGMTACHHTSVNGSCPNKYDMLLMETDNTGTITLAKSFHYGRDTRGYKVFVDNAGYYVVAGYINGSNCTGASDSPAVFIMRYDPVNNVVHDTKKFYPGPSTRVAGFNKAQFDIIQLPDDSGYIVSLDGLGRHSGKDTVLSVFKVTSDLSKVRWARMFDTLSQDIGLRMALNTEDKGFSIASFRHPGEGYSQCLGLTKADQNGELFWCRNRMDTTVSKSDVSWSSVSFLSLTTNSSPAFDSVNSLTVYKKNFYIYQNTCDEGVKLHHAFTVNTNNCTCSPINLVGDSDQYTYNYEVDFNPLGPSNDINSKNCGAGRHRITIKTSHWPEGETDTTIFVNLFQGDNSLEYTVTTAGANETDHPALDYIFSSNQWQSNSFGYKWDFGDGTPQDSVHMSPAHSFTVAGTYEVCLTVKSGYRQPNNYCESKICRVICIPANTHDCCNCK